MKIQHSDLVRISQILMDALSQSDIFSKEIDFTYDYYWSPSLGGRHDVYNQPEVSIGSIAHDLERIQQCIQNKEPTSCHYRWLGNILIAVADAIEYRIKQGESGGV